MNVRLTGLVDARDVGLWLRGNGAGPQTLRNRSRIFACGMRELAKRMVQGGEVLDPPETDADALHVMKDLGMVSEKRRLSIPLDQYRRLERQVEDPRKPKRSIYWDHEDEEQVHEAQRREEQRREEQRPRIELETTP